MEMSRKRVGFWGGVTGIVGTTLLACTACCIPVVASVVAWLGVAGLGLAGPYGLLLASLAASAIGLVALKRRRQRTHCQCSSRRANSACETGCSIDGNDTAIAEAR